MEHQPEEEGKKWEQQLTAPLPGLRHRRGISADDELKQLESLQG